ncbi:hypothetical protein B0I37DRAFT_433725 [Chaetomium sp. MPI-CAGE-AT-0009]|nr:hypothetical protein B0I37DRAFT_433725 [Chaetomium sp. MPI-CAGE-AT-0009]
MTPLLMALMAAGKALTYEVCNFIDIGLVKKEGQSTKNFVRAVYYYGHCWIIYTFDYYIEDITSRLSESPRGFQKLVRDLKVAIGHLKTSLEDLDDATEEKDRELDVRTLASGVSISILTACPYQLLLEAIFDSDEFVNKINDSEYNDADLLRNIHLFFPPYLNFPPNPSKRLEFGDGRPTVVFLSVYHDNGTRRILFGCNKPNWKGFPAVATLAREIREIRLQNYVPLGGAAFEALRSHEELFLDSFRPARAGGGEKTKKAREKAEKAARRKARNAAREAMKNDKTFLGGTHEVGMAFQIPGWTYKPACYLCSSVMGYQDPGNLSGHDREAYDALFSFEKRGKNCLACAESEARLQSFHWNTLNKRPATW